MDLKHVLGEVDTDGGNLLMHGTAPRTWAYGSLPSHAHDGAGAVHSIKSARQAQRFLSAHDQINNLSQLRHEHATADQRRAARTQAFRIWAELSGTAALPVPNSFPQSQEKSEFAYAFFVHSADGTAPQGRWTVARQQGSVRGDDLEAARPVAPARPGPPGWRHAGGADDDEPAGWNLGSEALN
jgi:hypothetical protein